MECDLFVHKELQVCCWKALELIDKRVAAMPASERWGLWSVAPFHKYIKKMNVPEARKKLLGAPSAPDTRALSSAQADCIEVCCAHAEVHRNRGHMKVKGFWCWLSFMLAGGFDTAQKAKLEAAIEQAKAALEKKKAKLMQPEGDAASITTWFGKSDPLVLARLRASVDKTLKSLAQLDLSNFVNPVCKECSFGDYINTKAYVNRCDASYTIYLQSFWGETQNKPLILVHETAHFQDFLGLDDVEATECLSEYNLLKLEQLIGTRDVKFSDIPAEIITDEFGADASCYGPDEDKKLAEKSPEDAAKNADNFAQYVMDL